MKSMGEAWTPEHDEKLQTHFDLVNSVYTIGAYTGDIVDIITFVGETISGILKKIGWDYIKLQIDEKSEAIRIDFVEEGRDTYKISSIIDNGISIYQHKDPDGFKNGIRFQEV